MVLLVTFFIEEYVSLLISSLSFPPALSIHKQLATPTQGATSPMAWSIMAPSDKSFEYSETDNDVALLKGYVADS